MIHLNLPSPELNTAAAAGSSGNHVFFSTTSGNYHHPRHETPWLLVANFRESGQYILNNRKTTASDNQFYLLNPGDRLEIDFTKKQELQTFLIAFDEIFMHETFQFASRSAEQLLENPEIEIPGSLSVPSVPFSMNTDIRRLLFRILKSAQEEETISEILNRFFQLLDETENSLENLRAVKQSTREEIYRRLFLSEEFIRAHLSEEVSLSQMASAACLNRFHYLNLFKEFRNTTPHQYLTKLRLEKAYEDLKSGRVSVTEACYASGFQSAASFSHLFKRKYGRSPSEIRK